MNVNLMLLICLLHYLIFFPWGQVIEDVEVVYLMKTERERITSSDTQL